MILRTCWTAFQPSSKTEGGAEVVATASNGIGAIRDTKVLLVSADDDHELGLCALDCGADGFIWKGSLVVQCRKQIRLMFGKRVPESHI